MGDREIGIKETTVTDLGMVRENRRLTERVAKLEAQLAAYESGSCVDGAITPHSKRPSACSYHLHVVVDMEAPVVECADCGTALDAISVLREFANEERRFRQNEEAVRQSYQKLCKEIDLLKKQRSSLRSQIKKKGGRPVGDNEYVYRPQGT